MKIDIEKLEALAEAAEISGDDVQMASYAVLELTQTIRDLQSSVSGLKTGYEAYERVNAELRAECEALRKNSARYQWLRDESESIHQFYLSTPIWFTGVKFSKGNVDSTIDAAMSKEASQ